MSVGQGIMSKLGMRGKRHGNEGEQPHDTGQSTIAKRDHWLRRVAKQMGSYVEEIQSTSQVARKHVAEYLRKGLYAVRSIDVSVLIKYLLSFVALDKATVYVGVPGMRFRGSGRLMSDVVHVYSDVEVVRIKINVNPGRLRFTRPRLANLKAGKLPFTVPDVTKLKFAVGPEGKQPYITITDPGTPRDWKDKLRDELGEPPRCWGASERPVNAAELVSLLVRYGVLGWQAAHEATKQAGPRSR
jgi:hypothetical protein